jgi:hypothetical protein
MGAGPGTLKLAGSIGTLLVCGASGLVVASNTKPADAPLKPPVDPNASLGQLVAQSAAQPPSVAIPTTPVCEPANAGIYSQGGANNGAGAANVMPDAAVTQVLQQYRQAKTAQERQQVLKQAVQTLSAADRQQLTAVLQQAAKKPQSGKGSLPGCLGTSSGSSTGSDPSIMPSTVDAPASATPVTVSAVS